MQGRGQFPSDVQGRRQTLLSRATGGGFDGYNACLVLAAACRESSGSLARLMFARIQGDLHSFQKENVPGYFEKDHHVPLS